LVSTWSSFALDGGKYYNSGLCLGKGSSVTHTLISFDRPSARGKPGQVSKFGKGQLSRLKFNVPLRCVKEVRFGPHTNTTPAEHLRRLQSSDSNRYMFPLVDSDHMFTNSECSLV
jgi:hypothetical protein